MNNADIYKSAARNNFPESLAYEMYRGVLIIWDVDRDRRVVGVIDDMPDEVRSKLLAIAETHGSVELVWDSEIPIAYRHERPLREGNFREMCEVYGNGFNAEGDWWCIMDQFVVTPRKATYSDKLADPRWQKKRLQVFNRDGFACVRCGATDLQLHVHHLHYKSNVAPWDYLLGELETMCADCHSREHGK